MIWRARKFEFVFPRPTLVMGVVNVTPDSFSDGGQFATAEAAAAHALKLAAEGADIIDIGGESTRPGAEPVAAEEELRRVLPVIEQLAGRLAAPISIDTGKAEVARAALAAGASIVNDILGNRKDTAMWKAVAESGAGYVLTHIRGTPQTMHEHPAHGNVVFAVDDFFAGRIYDLEMCGVKPEQVALDVGIGFGKGMEDNLRLLGELRRFMKWERPVAVGASRKSFIGRLLGARTEERLAASLACACWAAAQGASIIRCHDVAETRQALRMTEALMERR
jgi:dihydropteroate synthase